MDKHRCSGLVYRAGSFSPGKCMKEGKREYKDHWWCGIHYPPSIEEKRKKRSEKWEAEWEQEAKNRKAAKREQALKDKALQWMRTYHAGMVREWEEL